MRWLKVKRFLAEREVLIGLVIFGLFAMIADIFGDLQQKLTKSVIIRLIAIGSLLLLVLLDIWLKRRRQTIPVPLIFTEETDREVARVLFNRFVQNLGLNQSMRVIDHLSMVRRDDLLIRLDRSNPRQSQQPNEWKTAWEELLREWEREVDRGLLIAFPDEVRCYHVLPQVVLPLAFALGASVGLRRSLMIYHAQEGRFFKAFDLTEPRCLFEAPSASSQPPEQEVQSGTSDKLILYLIITDRHPINLSCHPDYTKATSVALSYKMALPEGDWLPYVQQMANGALALIGKYNQVEICLLCPSAIAFVLGMVFSRTPRITVCHWINNQYVPVFSLQNIEQRLPFD